MFIIQTQTMLGVCNALLLLFVTVGLFSLVQAGQLNPFDDDLDPVTAPLALCYLLLWHQFLPHQPIPNHQVLPVVRPVQMELSIPAQRTIENPILRCKLCVKICGQFSRCRTTEAN
jgi:hypothetical protein